MKKLAAILVILLVVLSSCKYGIKQEIKGNLLGNQTMLVTRVVDYGFFEVTDDIKVWVDGVDNVDIDSIKCVRYFQAKALIERIEKANNTPCE